MIQTVWREKKIRGKEGNGRVFVNFLERYTSLSGKYKKKNFKKPFSMETFFEKRIFDICRIRTYAS